MTGTKRIVQRIYGRKFRGGGIVYDKESLLKALKAGDAAAFGSISVGAAQLRDILRLVNTSDFLIKVNGRLEIQTVDRVPVYKEGQPATVKFSKARKSDRHFFGIANGAWLPAAPKCLVAVRTVKY